MFRMHACVYVYIQQLSPRGLSIWLSLLAIFNTLSLCQFLKKINENEKINEKWKKWEKNENEKMKKNEKKMRKNKWKMKKN